MANYVFVMPFLFTWHSDQNPMPRFHVGDWSEILKSSESGMVRGEIRQKGKARGMTYILSSEHGGGKTFS